MDLLGRYHFVFFFLMSKVRKNHLPVAGDLPTEEVIAQVITEDWVTVGLMCSESGVDARQARISEDTRSSHNCFSPQRLQTQLGVNLLSTLSTVLYSIKTISSE